MAVSTLKCMVMKNFTTKIFLKQFTWHILGLQFKSKIRASSLVVCLLLVWGSNALVYGGGQYIKNGESISFPTTNLSRCQPVNVNLTNISLVILNRGNAKLTATVNMIFTTATVTTTYSQQAGLGNRFEFGLQNVALCPADAKDYQLAANFALSGPLNAQTVSGRLTFALYGGASGSGFKDITLDFQGDTTPYISISGTNDNAVCNTETIGIKVSGDSPSNATVWAGGIQIPNGTVISDYNFSFNSSASVPYSVPDLDNQSLTIESRNARGNSSISIRVGAPLPTNMSVTANKPLPLCNVEPLTLSINNPANSTVSWPDGGANISSPTSKEYRAVVQRTIAGSTRTVNVCPSVTKSINVQVFTFNPTINQPSTTTRCQGEAIELTANPGGGGSFSYAWTRENTPTGGNSQTIPASQGGEYRVTVSPQGVNCPAKTASNSVRLNFDTPIEDINIQSPSTIICGAPDASTLELTAQPAGVNYNWSRDGGGFSGNGQKVTVSQAGKYIVNLNRGACNRQKTIDIRDNNYDKNIAAPPSAFCSDAPITLRANANDANRFDYVWKKDGMNVGVNSPTHQTNVGGTFTVAITAKNTGCGPKNSDAVAVVASTPISDEAIALPAMKERPILCGAPDEPSMVLTAVQTDVSYNWQGPGVNNATQKTLTVTQAGKYILNMVRGACAKQKEMTVEPNTYDANIATAPAAFCAKSPITLRANANDATKYDYAWKRVGMAVGSNTPTLLLTNEVGIFKYTVDITSKGTGCKPKTSAEVTINTDRAITGSKIALPMGKERAIICGDPENAIVLTAVADMPTEGIAYSWQGLATGMTNTLTAAQAGDYKVAFVRGTCAEEATVKVESGVFIPKISSTGTIITSPIDIRICNGEFSTVTAAIEGTSIQNNNNNFTYKWFGGADGNVEVANQKDNTLRVSTSGIYRLEMTLTGSGCPKKDAPQKIKIAVDPVFKNVKITPNPAIICNKDTGLEIAALSDSSAGASYQWSGGGRVGSDPSKYIVANAGTYSVNLKRGACFAQASVSPREEVLTVTVTPPNTSNPIIVCSGANGVPMELKAVSNLSTAIITWKRDNVDASGTNMGNSYTPTQTGQYYAVANFNNICTATSLQKIAIEALSNFAVNITPNNPSPLCDDRPIPLTATASDTRYTGLYNYEWMQDTRSVRTGIGANTLSTGKVVNYTGNTLALGNESSYTVSIAKDGCKATSPVSKLTLKPARSGIIVLDYNTLEATESSDNKYEWYYKALRAGSLSDSAGYSLEAGATGRTLLGAKIGSYLVRANRNGCGIKFSFANIVDITTAINPVLADEWRVYPNPTAEAITVENKSGAAVSATVEIWSGTGQRLQSFSQNSSQQSYSLGHLPAGVYYLQLREGAKTITKKIIKQ